MATQVIDQESVSGEALFILKSLKDNGRAGRSNKLADVKAALEPSVSLEFDSYFFFLRKFHYIAMDREAQLKLTDQGEKVVDGDAMEKFSSEISEFFSEQLGSEDAESKGYGSSAASRSNGDSSARGRSPPEVTLEEAEDLTEALPAPPPGRFSIPQASVSPLTPWESAPAAPPPVLAPAAAAANGSTSTKGTDLDGRYLKMDAMGSGPLGTVFRGRNHALGVDVCIKELKDIFGYFSFLQRGEVVRRLKKELCAQAAVRHPNVVAVLDQNTDGSRPYFVMELCRGSLRERLEQQGGKGLPVPQAMRYFLQLSYALRAAHAQGLVHHNLKPENVLFDGYGNAKLGDFGLSRVVEVDAGKGMPQVFVGTGGMAYLAPELINRTKDAGAAADVYSLGILLYEMLTGQIPGRRSPLPSEINAEVPTKLDPIFDKMSQDRKDGRYPDFDAMLTDFYGAFSEGEYLGRGDLVLWSDAARD